MPMAWKEFEQKCLDYLQRKYRHIYSAKFVGVGGSDSTKSDILVISPGGGFYLEVKMSKAQSGQFVVLPKGSRFIYSPRNKYPENKFSKQIMDYMNDVFTELSQVGTAGELLDIPSGVSFGWVINHYKLKGVKFIMSANDRGYVIFPVDRMAHYFKIEARYRVKKSGSSNPSQSDYEEIKDLINDSSAVYSRLGNELSVETIDRHDGDRLEGSTHTYMLKHRYSDTFGIRRLSNTNNANVIFTVELVHDQDPDDLTSFEYYLSH